MSDSSESPTSEAREIGRASGILASFTLLSRLLGLVRNLVLSHFFGASFVADAFVAAFTIPNALRRLLGEGALTPAIVSLLTRALKESKGTGTAALAEWQKFISNTFVWLTLALLAITGVAVIIAPALVRLYVPEFVEVPGKFELTVSLTRFLFPFIIFIGWFAFFMGVLNSFRSYAISAAGPAVLNLIVICGVPPLLIWKDFDPIQGIFVFGGAFLVGGLFQAIVQLPDLKRFKALPRLYFRWKDPRVTELLLMLGPSVFSMGVYQLNIIVNRVFASGIDGAVSHLFYADLLLELPVSIIATSVGTAAVTSFSRLTADQNKEGLSRTFGISMILIWALALPAMGGLIALALPIVSTLYFSGKFQWADVLITSDSVMTYALGLPFFATLRIILPLFFAEKDTRTPALVGIGALCVNFIAAWTFSKWLSTPGIALATSVSSAFHVSILVLIIFKRHRDFPWRSLGSAFLKMTFAAIVMAAALFFLLSKMSKLEVWTHHGISTEKIIILAFLVGAGIFVYFGVTYLIRVPHLNDWMKRLFTRLRSR